VPAGTMKGHCCCFSVCGKSICGRWFEAAVVFNHSIRHTHSPTYLACLIIMDYLRLCTPFCVFVPSLLFPDTISALHFDSTRFHFCDNIPCSLIYYALSLDNIIIFVFICVASQFEMPSTTTNPVGMVSQLGLYLVIRNIFSIGHPQTSGNPVCAYLP
jgi:hypothetical protein